MKVELEYNRHTQNNRLGTVTERVKLIDRLPEREGIFETPVGHLQTTWGETDLGHRYAILNVHDCPVLQKPVGNTERVITFAKDGHASYSGLHFYLDGAENMPQLTLEDKLLASIKSLPLVDPHASTADSPKEEPEIVTGESDFSRNLPSDFIYSERRPGGEKPFAHRTRGSMFWAGIPGERTKDVTPEASEEDTDMEDYIENQFKQNKGGE